MKITKTTLNQSLFAAMFLMSFAYSINVQAGVCEAEFNKHLQEREKNYIQAGAHNFYQAFKEEELLERERILESGKIIFDEEIPRHIEFYEREFRSPYPDVIADNAYHYCMVIAQRDGTLKSTKQAKNNKSTAESKQSQSANANSQDASNNNSSNNPKPLTNAELKAQKAEQEAQAAEQDVQEDTQRAQENQAKADKARQGKRRRHEPENVAHTCISPDFGGLYGALDNTCNYKVWYAFCSYRPKEKSFAAFTDCEKQSFGSDSVGPRKSGAVHTHNLEKIYWFACKDPAWPLDLVFEGDGIRGRCLTVGGE